jgi:hypothetical protein
MINTKYYFNYFILNLLKNFQINTNFFYIIYYNFPLYKLKTLKFIPSIAYFIVIYLTIFQDKYCKFNLNHLTTKNN